MNETQPGTKAFEITVYTLTADATLLPIVYFIFGRGDDKLIPLFICGLVAVALNTAINISLLKEFKKAILKERGIN